jgi:pimeloyl-ACP methyl ester carboxylesterase
LLARSVRYLESGGGRRALVLLHAFPLSADQWLPQLHHVPPTWRFVAPDLRGFRGAGPAFEDAPDVTFGGVSMDDYAADVLALMNHLDIDRAVIGGLSMGGYVAFALLRRAPERVAGLVLANTRATADSAEGRAGRDAMRELVEREGAAGIARAMLPKLIGATASREQPDLMEAVRQMIEANSTRAIAAAIDALKARPDSTPQLASIACPAIVIGGEHDAIVPPAESRVLAAAIPGATSVVLPRVGHLSNLEDPAGFNAALARALAASNRPT